MWGLCDNEYRLDNRVTYVCSAAEFNQSASTLRSGDTGLTLNSGNARSKKDKKMLSTRVFREYQGDRSDVTVCALVEL